MTGFWWKSEDPAVRRLICAQLGCSRPQRRRLKPAIRVNSRAFRVGGDAASGSDRPDPTGALCPGHVDQRDLAGARDQTEYLSAHAAIERAIVRVWRTVQPMTKLGRWIGERERRFAAKEWTGHRQRPSMERCQQSTYDNMRSTRFSPEGAVEAGAACV